MARFFRRGTFRAWWVPSLAAPAAPSAAEVAAGIELTDSIGDIGGFTYANSPIGTPDMGDTFTKSIPGEDVADESSFTFYEDDTANPLRVSLAKGAEGYIVIAFAGTAGAAPAAGDDVEVWAVICTGPTRTYSAGNEAAMWTSRFTPTERPFVDAVLAA